MDKGSPPVGGDIDRWTRLTREKRPSAGIATLENPRAVAQLVSATLVGSAVITAVMGYLMLIHDERVPAWITFGLSGTYLLTFGWYFLTGKVFVPGIVAVVVSMADVIVIHVVMGGYAYSGGHMGWGIALTFAVVLLLGWREGVAVAVLYVATAVFFGFIEPQLAASRPPPDPGLRAFLFTGVMIGNLVVLVTALVYFLRRVAYERQRAEHLLLNVLPAQVAAELKEKGSVAARRFDGVTVIFADIVGFTARYANTDPGEMVDQLNRIFTHFDSLVDRYGLEKIRTIGDAYMVAAGVPVPSGDHALRAAAMALDMLDYARNSPLTFRIGINSGPVVAGVIGTRKFQYDVWGDTVNTASRMESTGVPGRIQVSQATHGLIRDDFVCSPRGSVNVKGKGELLTWFLESKRTTADSVPHEVGKGAPPGGGGEISEAG